ncbi:MAG TPA: adenylate/guanylate cyclase domain-containing protein [Stellaceae bacterium]|nr:adenylate/guanylate cyclase domain-containing protein [Stellaceae bacterium]
MRCLSCGSEASEGAKFCGACGERLPAGCPHCGAANAVTSVFCTTCGMRLIRVESAGAGGRPHRPAASAPVVPEDERKEVSVLFADIYGSLGLIANRDPEVADAILSEVIDQLSEAVHRYGGTVNKIRGDGIMALFGAPVAQEDHAVRACCAAMAMCEIRQERVRAVAPGFDIPIQIRVGVSSGEAVVRKMVTDTSIIYDAVGEIVHLGSRMEESAAPGTVRLTGATYRLVRGVTRTIALGRLPVKGLAQPIEVYELVEVDQSASSARWLRRQEPTRFVNRTRELAGLKEALEDAAAGKGQLVALVGEAGFGKSRLLAQVLTTPRAGGFRVLKGGSSSNDRLTGFLPCVQMFRSLFSIQVGEDAESVAAKVQAATAALSPDLAWTVPALLSLLGAEPREEAWVELDPQERRRQIIDAIRGILLRASQAQPLILVVEDLHWLDAESQDALDHLVESLSGAAILCILTYRPEYRHEWSGKAYYRQYHLSTLPTEDAVQLLNSLIGGDAQVEELKRLLINRTAANPFFMEECVYALVDDNVLIGKRGAYQMAGSLDTLRIPGTVKALLADRIDRLKPEEKRILQAAAVIGEDVPLALLSAVVDLPRDKLSGAIATLRKGEFLYEKGTGREVEYSFRHALTHDVAYGSMLKDRRRALHARILAGMETLYEKRIPELAERLAYHAGEGTVWDRVVRYGQMAGAKAAWRSANEQAVSFFEQALEGLLHLPQDARAQCLAIDIRLNLRTPLFQLGRLNAVVAHLNEAKRIAEQLGDQGRLAHVLMYLNHVFWLQGKREVAFAMGERALALAKTLGDEEREVRTNFHLGITHLALNDFRRTVDLMRETVAACRKASLSGTVGPLASQALGYMARALAELGEFPQARAAATEAIDIAEAEARPFTMILAQMSAGYVRERQGDHAGAIPLLERAHELCRANEARLLTPIAAGFLGTVLQDAGDVDAALPLLKEAVETAAEIQLMLYQPLRLAKLARAYYEASQLRDARDYANQAEALAIELKEPAVRAEVALLLAEIDARTNQFDLEELRKRYGSALSAAEAVEMRPLIAHIHRSLGMFERRSGDAGRAEQALQAAQDLYAKLGMASWEARLSALAAK